MRKPRFSFALFLFLILFTSLAAPPAQSQGKEGMVVSASSLASRIGLEVMARGGNAVDAAVAVGFVLAVVHPSAGNIGGGGFMLIHQARTNEQVVIDYRERAPLRARRDMYLDEDREVNRAVATVGHEAVAVPGTVAGLALALKNYGTISWKDALAPAIALAEGGFEVSKELSQALKTYQKEMMKYESTAEVFFPRGKGPEPGERLSQKDLAQTLKGLAEAGPDAFYRGKIADLIVAEMRRGGGLISKEDLARYQPVVRVPIKGTYRGFQIISAPPPSSGGTHIIQTLNMLEGFDLKSAGPNSASSLHLLAEAMKRAFADRARYLGDPDFVAVPVKGIISKDYARGLAREIKDCCATEGSKVGPGIPQRYESGNTTHFSIVDPEGNAVSNTYTLNFPFGSKVVVKGAGFLLNNEMDDFTLKPGAANAYGLVTGDANIIAPGKRMLSSMAPTMLFKDGKLVLVTGAAGGARIISTSVQLIVNLVDHGMDVIEATRAGRIHHQWLPDRLFVEEEIDSQAITELKARGQKVVPTRPMGVANSIWVDPASGQLTAAPDPRGTGAAAGF